VLLLNPAPSSERDHPKACDSSQYRFAIDVGHSKTNPGATSARGVPEFEFNLRLSRLLSQMLKDVGFSDHFLIGESGASISLKDRVRIANERAADVFISVHHDSVQSVYLSEWMYNGRKLQFSDKFSGYSLFISGENPSFQKGRHLAVLLADALNEHGFAPSLHHAEPIAGENRPLLDANRGIYQWDKLGVVRSTKMPAVLLEAGVIVNRNEELRLSDPETQMNIAKSIVSAIQKFCTT
jgi:N-acetylmuramoyl-L-alanine amidase